MKAKLLGRFIDINSSISFQNYASSYFLNVLHYHPEFELDVIKKSTGIRFIGDCVERFEPGDIVLIGKDLPHLWLNDDMYFQSNSQLIAEAVVIHFGDSFVSGLQSIPEMMDICDILNVARLGIFFTGIANQMIVEKVELMGKCTGYRRVLSLIDILGDLTAHNEYKILSSPGFLNSYKEIHVSRMEPVYNHVMNNFKQEIKLETVAQLANMNPTSFSRYFSNYHKKTFTQFLNHIRIGYSCRLLIENNLNIASVCYDSGFNNISNFNRIFKTIKKMTPSEYLALHSITTHYK